MKIKSAAAVLISLFLFSCVSLKESYRETRTGPVSVSKENLEKPGNSAAAPVIPAAGSGIKNVGLRVLISKNVSTVRLSSVAAITAKDVSAINPSASFVITSNAAGFSVNGFAPAVSSVEFVSASNIFIDGKEYRGGVTVFYRGGRLFAVNNVSLRDYLFGVVPCEVPPSWPEEALKAQAVAARTFAMYNRLKNKTPEYDLDSTVLSQVYKGVGVEHEKTSNAVTATADEVLAYNGEIIQSFFHSNSGGKTASSEEVWGGKFDYLVPVDDGYCRDGRHYAWKASVESKKISEILSKNKISAGDIFDMQVYERTGSGRAGLVKIYGGNGTFTVKAKDLRMWAGPDLVKSTMFNVMMKDGTLEFNGTGWGHGVGLSQESSRKMAEEGLSYRQILRFFYRGTEIKKARID